MRSIIDVLDLSTEEITELIHTAEAIMADRTGMHMHVTGRNWQPCSLSLLPGRE